MYYRDKLTELHKIPLSEIKKIEFVSYGHDSTCSMVKEGIFPLGTKRIEVEQQVQGTFGGIFEVFDSKLQRFKYIAYTD